MTNILYFRIYRSYGHFPFKIVDHVTWSILLCPLPRASCFVCLFLLLSSNILVPRHSVFCINCPPKGLINRCFIILAQFSVAFTCCHSNNGRDLTMITVCKGKYTLYKYPCLLHSFHLLSNRVRIRVGRFWFAPHPPPCAK